MSNKSSKSSKKPDVQSVLVATLSDKKMPDKGDEIFQG